MPEGCIGAADGIHQEAPQEAADEGCSQDRSAKNAPRVVQGAVRVGPHLPGPGLQQPALCQAITG